MNKKQSKKIAQGALEYLVIIATVLAIAAIITTFLTDAFGARRKEAMVSQCRTESAECYSRLQVSPDSECPQCLENCAELEEHWPEEFPNATERCKRGEMDKIEQPIEDN